MKKAKAAVFTGIDLPFEIREYELTAPPAGMARLKLCASGICGTDLHILRGKLPLKPPLIIGHEFVGTVDAISEEDSHSYGISVGDNAIAYIAVPCGQCELCRSGDEANCPNMNVTNGGNPEDPPHFWGGYGEYNFTPVSNLVKIPLSLDPRTVCVFACAGPTVIHAFSLAARANFSVRNVKTAVVQGFGPVGAFTVFYLSALGVKNIAVVTAHTNQKRAALAASLGASRVFSLEEAPGKPSDYVISQIGRPADIVVEASGSPAAIPVGLELLRNRGLYLVPGQYSNSGGVTIDPQLITFKALSILGSSQYTIPDVKVYLNLMEHSQAYHSLMASLASEFPVTEINRAMANAAGGKSVKTILV